MSETPEVEPAAPAEPVEATLEVGEVVVPVKRRKNEAPEVPASAPAVLGKKSYDNVYLSAMVYKNEAAKRSTSVWHLQRRLAEWGHLGGLSDRAGYYGDRTANAVLAFQTALGLKATGFVDAQTLERVFEGDTNVKVSLA
ncbi:MAG: peptidoglycan-binding domain-containing protein [Cetobacterium sp.]